MSQSDLKTERIARAGRVILGVYICILLPVLSFWAPQGYSHLGNSKFLIYRFISVPFAVILLPLVIARICFLLRRSKPEATTNSGRSPVSGKPEASADSTGNPASGRKDVSENYVINTASGRKSAGRMLVVPAIVYLLFLTVSFVLAFDHNEALWGTVGWRMGFLSRLLFVFFFIAGILFRPTGPDQAASFPRMIFFPVVFVSGAPVLLLGILNRFSIYPLPYMGVDDSFISTMGNINWYGGYLVLVFAVALGEFICGTSALRRVFAAVLLFLSLFSLVTQGSDGTSLAFAAGVIAACIGVCLMDRGEENVSEDLYAPSGILTRFILLIGLLGVALEAYNIIWAIYPLSLVSRDINFWFTPARYHAGLILIAVCILLLFLRRILKRMRVLILVICVATLTFGSVALLVTVMSAASPDTYIITGGSGRFPWLDISDSFGNDRGAIWRICGDYFRSLPPVRKCFGVGPDCFSAYAYLDPVISMELVTSFGTARLTNAHCGLFTVLINEGVFGAVSVTVFYVISWISLFAALRGKRDDAAVALRGKRDDAAAALRGKGADAETPLRGKGAGSVTTFSAFVALTALLAIWGISFPTVCSLPLLLLLIGV